MPIAITLFGFLLSLSTASGQQPDPPVACNLNAIKPAQRERYKALRRDLEGAVRQTDELPDGFRFRIEEASFPLAKAAEWISLERLCCPFLEFELQISGSPGYWLHLTGPRETKAILRSAFPKAR